MAVTAAELLISVRADTSQASTALRGFGSQVDSVGVATGKTTTQLRDAQGRFTSMGAAAGTAGKKVGGAGKGAGLLNMALGDVSAKSLLATAGLAGLGVGAINLGKTAVNSAIDFETAFAGVAKTVEATDAELDVLEQGIRDMATTMPMAATELANIAEAAGALGIAKGDILAFTETVALIGTTTDVSSDQAATSLGQLTNVLNLTADEFDGFASALVALGNDGASTESAILGITTRSGAAAELIGFATDETLGWSAAVANLGIEVAAGGTSLQRFFLDSAKHVAAAGDELDLMAETAGMTGEAFQQAFAEDSSAALQTFVVGLGELDQASQLAVLSALGFSDVRITRSLLGLANNTDNLSAALDTSSTALQDGNAHLVEAEKRFDTTASKIQIAKNKLNEYNLTLSEGYLPAIQGALTLSEPLLQTLIESASVYADLAAMIRDTNAAIDDYIPSIGGASDGTANYAKAFAEVMTSLIPGVAQVKTMTGVWGLFNDETEESTELTKSQTAALNEWVGVINEALPGIQSQTEARSRLNDVSAETQQRQHELGMVFREADAAAEAYIESQNAMSQEGHRANQMAIELGVSVNDLDRTMQDLNTEGVDPLTEALDGLAGAYQEALDVMGAFNSQASEFEGIGDTITAAYEEIQKKQEAGIELTDKEIMFLDDHEEALGRLEGGQRDATIEAGFAALAAVELMEAQDALNQAIEDGVTDLTPYKQAVADAEEKLGIMGSTTGETQDAQGGLADVINGPLIGAIQDLTRKVEYIAKPWLIEIDAATAAAEAEIQRIKDIISAGATLPVTVEVSGGDVGGIVNHARGTGPHGTPRDMLSWVGEEGPELAWLPQGTHVLPSNESMKFAALMGTIPGYAEGTGASAGSLPGSPPAPPHGGSMGVDWEAIAQAEAEAWVDLFGDAVDAAFSDNPLGFIDGVQDEINSIQNKIDLAPAMGVPAAVVAGWEEDLAGLKGEQDAFWASFAQAVAAGLVDPAVLEQLDAAGLEQLETYLEPIVGPEGAAKIVDGIGAVTQITAEGLGQLRTIFAEDTEAAVGYVDDLVQAALDGSISWADAMSLMGDIPRDDLLPVLEDMEKKFKDDLVEAILAGDVAAQQLAEQGLAMVQDALVDVNGELDQAIKFIDRFSDRAGYATEIFGGVITSAGGGGGGSSGGGSSGGGSSGGASSSGATSDPNALIPAPPDDSIAYLFDRQMRVQRLDSPGGEDYLSLARERGVSGFYYNPEGGGQEKLRIDFDEAADLLLGTGRLRQYAAFARGGVTSGPQFALLGDNPSGTEAVIPLERAGEFGALIARELLAEMQHGGDGGGGDVFLDGQKVGQILSGRIANDVRGRAGVGGIPVGARR